MTAYDDALAMFEAAMAGASPNGHETCVDDELGDLLIDWKAFWDVDRTEAEWLAEPILAAGRSHAIFAKGGTGKSLLALWLAAALATGRPIFGHHTEPHSVLYLDYEMTEGDLSERLEAMGYGPDDDLSRLHYALLPSLPAMDSKDGGKALARLAELCDAELVVIDTFGRAVHGDENDADTTLAWYRHTGIKLKAAGRAFVRIDHAGKDVEKGQRGSSAKNDDVDVVWRLAKLDDGAFRLTAEKRRMGWVPEVVELAQREDDGVLSYSLLAGKGWPAGTKELAEVLDGLGLPPDASVRTTREALKGAGKTARNDVLRAAVKYRKGDGHTLGHTLPAFTLGTVNGTEVGTHETPAQSNGHTGGHAWAHPPESQLGTVPPPKGGTAQDHPPTTIPDPEELF